MAQNDVNLTGIFQAVTRALAENQHTLNQADTYNSDHGSNMVQTFQTIASALEKNKGGSDSAALSYAAEQLFQNTTSGSGKMYAQNLAQAAGQLQGHKMDSNDAMQLLMTLIGGGQSGQPASQVGDTGPFGPHLGGQAGGDVGLAQQSSQPGSALLGTLLGGLLGGGESSTQQPSQTGNGNLLGGGTGGSESGLQALAQVFLALHGMGKDPHRSQSTGLVVNAFLRALGAMVSKS